MVSRHDSGSSRGQLQAAVGECLASAQGIREAVPLILRAVCEQLEWSVAAYWELDALRAEFRRAASYEHSGTAGGGNAAGPRPVVLPCAEGLPGRVLSSGRPDWVADLWGEPDLVGEWAANANLRCALAIPVGDVRGMRGVLELYGPEPRPPDREAVGLLREIAAQLAEFAARCETVPSRDINSVAGAIIRSAVDAVVVIDSTGRILDLNHAAEAMFGYPLELAKGKQVDDLIIPRALRDMHRAGIARYLATGESPVVGRRYESTALRANGKEFAVEIAVTAVHLPGEVLFAASVRDITGRRLQEDRVRRASEFKEELLGLISHELRSPLTAIRGNVALLARMRKPESVEEEVSLRQLQEYTERVERVVSNMLALGKVESGREIPTEPVLLRHLIAAAVERFRELRPQRVIEVHVEDGLPLVLADPTFVEQIIENFLSNADKYSPAAKPIHIEARTNGGSVEISVRDEGEGMPQAELNRLFDPFFRAERDSGRAPGIGLGLTVCRRLVEAQRGKIWARAAAEGGTIFAFSLPVAHDPA